MIKFTMDKIRKWAKEGMYWPFVHDPVLGQPSVTLMFLYMTFIMAYVLVGWSSVALVLAGKYLTATYMPIIMFTLGYVFYRLRRLDSVELDLDDRSIKLSGSSEDLNAPKEGE